jgi:hypothetical protein
MVNQAQIASLVARPVPPERECVTDLTSIVAGVVDFTYVGGLASQIASPTGVTPVTNNIGQQALTLAQANLVQITALESKTVERRVVTRRTPVPTGDSIQSYAISPAMPSADYEVRVSIYGDTTHPTAYFGWRVVSGTQEETSFDVSFENMKAGSLVTIVVEDLLNVEA